VARAARSRLRRREGAVKYNLSDRKLGRWGADLLKNGCFGSVLGRNVKSPRKFCLLVSVAALAGLAGCGWLPGGAEGEARPLPLVESASPEASEPARLSFSTHVQPVLSEYCYHCHGPDAGTREPKSDPLRLDLAEFALAARGGGKPAIIPGKPEDSLVVKLMRTENPEAKMPPAAAHKEMPEEAVALIERWIAEGAAFEQHWAFVPPQRPGVPVAAVPAKVRNPIDAFIQRELAAAGLEPQADDDPRALARRAALDLTGLLPSAADVEAFAGRPDDASYRAMLDRLFESPAYAEHRARYWLDYVRYADTHGLHFDNYRSIWPYRDYIIRSFAAHKPFDQFVREQVAGDLLEAADADPWIATGYLRSNVTTNEGGTIPEEIHSHNTRDRTEAFGAAFLGVTVGCAACHDHKFDPVSAREFYSLAAFFHNTADLPWDRNRADPEPVLRLPADPEKRAALDAAVAARAMAARKWDALRRGAAERFRDWLAGGGAPRAVDAAGLALHLPFDEGRGDRVHNRAPAATAEAWTVTTNPPVWGEYLWLHPSARFDIASDLEIPEHGDFDTGDAFAVAFWARPRIKVGGGATGDGAFVARMGRIEDDQHRGWDVFLAGDKVMVHLVHRWPDQAILVEAAGIPRSDWTHLGFSYDGSAKAAGVKIFVNGHPVPVKATHDSLAPELPIRTSLPMTIGSRHGEARLRELAMQDLRIYRRALAADEFAALPFEHHAAAWLAAQPDPASWTGHQRHFALERFFLGTQVPEAAALRAEIDRHDAEIARLGQGGVPTLIARERPEPAHAWVLARGEYAARSEVVATDVPAFMPPLPGGAGASRLDLAEWLFRPDHPLFARVAVNRAWQEIFGRGLVETPDDFGIMGARPSHPELLDWLAVEFRESGWNLRHIYTLMLESQAYRQARRVTPEILAADPDNRLLSRGPRFRMDAEMLRDTALQASGLLVPKVGGPPVKPYQPAGIWEAVSMPESDTLKYQQDSGEALYRRSLYTFWKRFAPPPSLETFDAQAREVVCVVRARTNTPLQALVSMNDPQFVEAARKLAERALHAAADPAGRIDFLARTLLARPLASAEQAAAEARLARYAAHYRGHPDDARALLATGAAPADTAFDPAETAAWTMLANQFLNLDETLVK
jgi:hypothetical protein